MTEVDDVRSTSVADLLMARAQDDHPGLRFGDDQWSWRQVARDDSARTLTYSIVDGAPVESHRAVITVTPTGDSSSVTWEVDAAPDEMADLMTTMYQGSLDEVKKRIEG